MYTGLMESARGTGAKLQDVANNIVSCRICGVLKLFDSIPVVPHKAVAEVSK